MTVKVAVLEAIPAPASASALTRWYVLLVMCMVYTLSIADRYVISTVLEPIRLELHLTDSGVAFLTGVSLALFYVSFGIPISLVADRLNRRNIIAVSLIAWSAMTVLFGRATKYWQLLVGAHRRRRRRGRRHTGGELDHFGLFSLRPASHGAHGLFAGRAAWRLGGLRRGGPHRRCVRLARGVPRTRRPGHPLRQPGCSSPCASRGAGRWTRWAAAASPRSSRPRSFSAGQRSACHLMWASALTALWGWGLTWWTPAFLMRNYGLSAGAGRRHHRAHPSDRRDRCDRVHGLAPGTAVHERRAARRMVPGRRIGLATVPSIVIFWTHSLELTQAHAVDLHSLDLFLHRTRASGS